MPKIEIYKPTQGRYTRYLTLAGVMVLALAGAYVMSQKLPGGIAIRFGVPALLVAVVAAVTFWIINRPRSADFLIATEGEMKKVSWSSRKEVIGSTKVVIVTTLILTVILYAIDLMFVGLFSAIGITPGQ